MRKAGGSEKIKESRNQKVETIFNSSKLIGTATLPDGEEGFCVLKGRIKRKDAIGVRLKLATKHTIVLDMRDADNVKTYDAKQMNTLDGREYCKVIGEPSYVYSVNGKRPRLCRRFMLKDGTTPRFQLTIFELLAISYIAYLMRLEGNNISQETNRQLEWLKKWRTTTGYSICGTNSDGIPSVSLESLEGVKVNSLKNLCIGARHKREIIAPLGVIEEPIGV